MFEYETYMAQHGNVIFEEMTTIDSNLHAIVSYKINTPNFVKIHVFGEGNTLFRGQIVVADDEHLQNFVFGLIENAIVETAVQSNRQFTRLSTLISLILGVFR